MKLSAVLTLLLFATLTSSSNIPSYNDKRHALTKKLSSILSRQGVCGACPSRCVRRGRARRLCRRFCARDCVVIEDFNCRRFARRFRCVPRPSQRTPTPETPTPVPPTPVPPTPVPPTPVPPTPNMPVCSLMMVGEAGQPGVRAVCTCGNSRSSVLLLQPVEPPPPRIGCLNRCYEGLLGTICNEDDFAEFVSRGNMDVDQCCERCRGTVNRISRQCI